jgi:hypothetical protein
MLKHFEDFAAKLADRKDSERSLTVDLAAPRAKATADAKPFKDTARAKSQEADRIKDRSAELKKAKPQNEGAIGEAETQISGLLKGARNPIGGHRSGPVRAGLGGVRRRLNAMRTVPSWAPGRAWCPAFIPARENEKEMVRAEGVEPSRAFAGSTDFHATSAFAAAMGVRGLDYPFTVRTRSGGGAARLVSTPSRTETFRPSLARDRHFRVPRLWAVLHRRFPGRALKFSSSPLRLPVPPHPHCRSSAAVHDRATVGIGLPQFSSASRRGLAFLPDFGFLFALGLILLIAAVSSRVLMCAA